MKNNKNVLQILRSISYETVGDTNNIKSSYLKLCKNFYGYVITDLLMLAKIDRLLELELISQKEHDYLYSLFEERNVLFDYLFAADEKEQDKIKEYAERLESINEILLKYDVEPTSFTLTTMIDGTIKSKKERSLKLKK